MAADGHDIARRQAGLSGCLARDVGEEASERPVEFAQLVLGRASAQGQQFVQGPSECLGVGGTAGVQDVRALVLETHHGGIGPVAAGARYQADEMVGAHSRAAYREAASRRPSWLRYGAAWC